MTCTRCGRHLKHGETLCLNCGEPVLSVINPKIREKPSDIISCLVIGLFVIFGIPALLFGGYLLLLGMGVVGSNSKLKDGGTITVLVSIIPLGVFVTLLAFVVRVWFGNRSAD